MTEAYEGIRFLDVPDIRFWRNDLGQLCATLDDGTVVDEVLVFRTCPISDPSRYISIRVGATPTRQREIGLIRNLNALPPEQRRLLAEELAKRYFIHLVARIRTIRDELGYLYWECDTDKGTRQFATPRWDQRSVYTGANGCRVITDVDGSRYEIPDLDELDATSRALFHRYVYW
jgi:hypothetical protein